ncbi:MAG: PfkB family carbohydrate kinase [Treponema sp.]|nr:PfkB family carbohydrate kinase [Treponema sp.]
MSRILCICLSSTIQRSVAFEGLNLTKVNRSNHYSQYASGKAINSARVLNQLEKGCSLSICPAGEKNLDLFLTLAEKDDLEIQTVSIPGFTRECWTLLDTKNETTTELVVGEPVTIDDKPMDVENQEVKLLKLIYEAFPLVDAVLLAGSRPGIWHDDLYAAIAGMAKDNGKIFLADYIGQDMEKTLKQVTPDIIKINDEEFIKTFYPSEEIQDFSEEKLKNSIIEISKKLGNMVVVTRGTKSTYGAKNGEFSECPVEKVKALNTTACGDSFNAGFLYEYLKSGDFTQALKKGTWCAARNAEVEAPGSLY